MGMRSHLVKSVRKKKRYKDPYKKRYRENLAVLVAISIIIVGITSISTIQAQDSEIPAWIKNNAGWWATDQIDDSAFVQGIQYLIREGIIVV